MSLKKVLYILFAVSIVLTFGFLSFRVALGLEEFTQMSEQIKLTEQKINANIEIIKTLDRINPVLFQKVSNEDYSDNFFKIIDDFFEKSRFYNVDEHYPESYKRVVTTVELLKKNHELKYAKKLLVELSSFDMILLENTLSEFKISDEKSLVRSIETNNEFIVNVIILALFIAITFIFWVFLLIRNIKKRETLETSLHDLTKNLEQKVHERTIELEDMLYVDSLTKLNNAFVLKDDISKAYLTTVFMIRLNDFGRLNELYGASSGNIFLEQFAELLKGFVENKEYKLYRYAGVEFAILDDSGFIDTDVLEEDVEELMALTHKSCIDIKSIDEVFQVDVSIGIASGTDKVLDKASTALRYARSHNCNFTYYNLNIDQVEENKTVLERKKDIKKTLDKDCFIPVFQPIVDVDGNIIKYETLMRMLKMDGDIENLMSPYHFLDIALKTNLYHRISEMVMRKSIEYFKDRNIDFSLNFALWDMENKGFIHELEELIKKYNIGKRVIFEIVETENIENYEMFRKFIERFRKMGVRIAIDDFGSGYSNFSYIIDIKPDYLKIDGSLIKNIDVNRESYILVKAIVELASSLGIKTIAEFVRSDEIFYVCKNLGINEFQGYLFSAPLREI